jgi:hypothetical protein
MTRIISFRIVSLVLLCAFFACNMSSTPTEADGKKVVENKLAAAQPDTFRVINFRKLNGQMSEVAGVKNYSLEYEVELELMRDIPGNFLMQGRSKGEKNTSRGTLRFEQTENGWKGEDKQLY